jgi:DNA-3-methyladenine glycosylase I
VTLRRCAWAPLDDPLYLAYHDEEWGVPVHDDHRLFEMLTLEGAQAGLSWSTILHKREGYRRAFAGFDPAKVARFNATKVELLLQDPSIVRNRLKVESAVANAQASLDVQRELGSLDAYLWELVDGAPTENNWRKMSDIPSETPVSQAMSKDLKKRGFRFVGPTVCYAFMQAVGMVNDHVASCFRYAELGGLRRPSPGRVVPPMRRGTQGTRWSPELGRPGLEPSLDSEPDVSSDRSPLRMDVPAPRLGEGEQAAPLIAGAVPGGAHVGPDEIGAHLGPRPINSYQPQVSASRHPPDDLHLLASADRSPRLLEDERPKLAVLRAPSNLGKELVQRMGRRRRMGAPRDTHRLCCRRGGGRLHRRYPCRGR